MRRIGGLAFGLLGFLTIGSSASATADDWSQRYPVAGKVASTTLTIRADPNER